MSLPAISLLSKPNKNNFCRHYANAKLKEQSHATELVEKVVSMKKIAHPDLAAKLWLNE
jgi:hypothetical protein